MSERLIKKINPVIVWSKVRPMPSINTYKCTVRINWLDLSSILLTTADYNCRYGEEFIVGNNWFIWSPDGHDNTDTSHFNARARLCTLLSNQTVHFFVWKDQSYIYHYYFGTFTVQQWNSNWHFNRPHAENYLHMSVSGFRYLDVISDSSWLSQRFEMKCF